MIHILHHDNHTCRIEGANAAIGKQLRTIVGSTWQRGMKSWLVPIDALGQVYRICGLQNVAVEYDVLVAFDESMRRMVRQYATCGVRIWLDDGMVRSDCELVEKLLQPRSQWLAPFLGDVEPTRTHEVPPSGALSLPSENEGLRAPEIRTLDVAYVEGIKNAMKLEERAKYYATRNW